MRLTERDKQAKKARRLNARKSSGPKTETGKSRVSRNALTHGLSIPFGLLPNASGAIDRLAFAILASINLPESDPRAWQIACVFAEAQLDLERIRSFRKKALSEPIVKFVVPTLKEFRKLLSASKRIEDPEEAVDYVIDNSRERVELNSPPLPERYKLLASRLQRLDRYERRALSRRKNALRLLSELQGGTPALN
jgi:hypothetical protein